MKGKIVTAGEIAQVRCWISRVRFMNKNINKNTNSVHFLLILLSSLSNTSLAPNFGTIKCNWNVSHE